jgi:ATP-dependent DNA ligase
VKAAELLGLGFALVVGWTDPEGRRPWLGALLLAYYDPDGRLSMPAAPAPASTRPSLNVCGAACSRSQQTRCRSRCRPRAAAASARRWSSVACIGCGPSWSEVKFLTSTGDNLLRQVVYEGLREDKPSAEVRREGPYPKPGATT